ncbi:MAG: hypothetical protein KAI74_04015, partial [Kiritimatiellae bacterium]|nr:hypothetical protein [Kiritimatiellia bacterium]
FSGTSSGSAMVAGVCTALQSYCLKNFGFTLGPIEIRQLLKDTGIAQGAGGHIGPLPNMRAAIEALNDQYLPTLVATPDSITVTEGEAGEFYVKLSNMPVSNITVTLTVSNYNADVQITSTNTLLYTDSNWNTNQTVTVLMGHDAGFISGYGTITMSAPQFTNEYIVYETETDLDPDFSLPFNETFENDGTNAGVLGPVDGQHGWVSESTNVVVVNSDAYAGSQSCAVENGILNHQYYDAQTNVQVIFYAKDQTITEDVREVPDTVAAGFHLNADRNIVAYSNTVQLTYTNLTVNLGTWYKYTLNCDYGNREWSLYVDDNLVFTNLAFGTNVAVSFSSVEVDNDRSATPSYIDNFSIISLGDEVPPGNIPSWWLDYYFTNGADSAEDADPDGDSFDNYAEWIALTDPTNSSSFFEMSDVATAAGDSVILWQGNSNRMYSVWWTSDLDLNFSSVTTGLYGVTGLNTYTDSIERVSDPNFYLIKVNLPE